MPKQKQRILNHGEHNKIIEPFRNWVKIYYLLIFDDFDAVQNLNFLIIEYQLVIFLSVEKCNLTTLTIKKNV